MKYFGIAKWPFHSPPFYFPPPYFAEWFWNITHIALGFVLDKWTWNNFLSFTMPFLNIFGNQIPARFLFTKEFVWASKVLDTRKTICTKSQSTKPKLSVLSIFCNSTCTSSIQVIKYTTKTRAQYFDHCRLETIYRLNSLARSWSGRTYHKTYALAIFCYISQLMTHALHPSIIKRTQTNSAQQSNTVKLDVDSAMLCHL